MKLDMHIASPGSTVAEVANRLAESRPGELMEIHSHSGEVLGVCSRLGQRTAADLNIPPWLRNLNLQLTPEMFARSPVSGFTPGLSQTTVPTNMMRIAAVKQAGDDYNEVLKTLSTFSSNAGLRFDLPGDAIDLIAIAVGTAGALDALKRNDKKELGRWALKATGGATGIIGDVSGFAWLRYVALAVKFADQSVGVLWPAPSR